MKFKILNLYYLTKQFSIFVFISFIFYQQNLFSKPIINEIMAAPITNEPEWIEIYNPDSISFELINCYINDKATSIKLANITIFPRRYIILTKDTVKLKQKRKFPEQTNLHQSKMPAFNNTTDVVVLRNSDSTVIDSVYYDMKWGKTGISLERKDWSMPATSQENIGKCISPDSATAGYENSIAIKDYNYDYLVEETADTIYFRIFNKGRYSLNNCDLTYFIDYNRNGIFQNSEIIHEESKIEILKNSVYEKTFLKKDLTENYSRYGDFETLIIFGFSGNKGKKDSIKSKVLISYPFGSIKINEIIFDVSSEYSEYIELWNSTEDTINLSGWWVRDHWTKTSQQKFIIDNNEYLILPYDYFVIALDSGIFNKFPFLSGSKKLIAKKSNLNLNLDGDLVLLSDRAGSVIDSVVYSNKWHTEKLTNTKNISLEKIKPELISNSKDSWTSCGDPNGGTPTIQNSTLTQSVFTSNLKAEPNPFLPFNSAKKSNCTILYRLPYKNAYITVRIFDTDGIPILTPVRSRFTGMEGSVIWDGRDEDGRVLPIGPYIFLLEAVDSETGNSFQDKTVIVIGK